MALLDIDMSDIRDPAAVETVEICAASRSNLLLVGGLGNGMTMLARRIPGILPALSPDERDTMVDTYERAGLVRDPFDWVQPPPPFRAPHHTVSRAGLLGTPQHPFRGEVQLARFGVLYLDQLVEFTRATVEALGQHLRAHVDEAPLIVASAWPCACGRSPCTCSEALRASYLKRRDQYTEALGITALLRVEGLVKIDPRPRGDTSEVIRARVTMARRYAPMRAAIAAADGAQLRQTLDTYRRRGEYDGTDASAWECLERAGFIEDGKLI